MVVRATDRKVEEVIIRIGFCRRSNPETVQAGQYDTTERETHVYLQGLLGDSAIDRVWVRKGAYVVYLKGDPK